jgi:hypothetical protein
MLDKRWDHIRNVKSDGDRTLIWSRKNGLRHEFPILRPSNSITAFLIKFCVDGCLRHVRQTVRTHSKCKKWRRQNKNKTLTSATKKRIATWISNATPIQWHDCLPHWFCVEWSLRNVWQTVRTHSKCKIETQQKATNTYLCHKKTDCDTSFQFDANPMASLSSPSNSASNDA